MPVVRNFNELKRGLSSATALISTVHRSKYILQYKTKVVLSDGSSTTVRYHEPKQIIKLPVDLSQLSEAEAKVRLERRKPKTKVVIDEELTTFDTSKYLKLMKK